MHASPNAAEQSYRFQVKNLRAYYQTIPSITSLADMAADLILRVRSAQHQPNNRTSDSRNGTEGKLDGRSTREGGDPLLLGYFLFRRDRPLGTFARSRVGLRALAADGKSTAMAQAAVATNVGQPLDVPSDLTAQVALDLDLAVDRFAQFLLVIRGEIFDPNVGVDTRLSKQLLCGREPNTENVREGDLDSLFAR
jgi:hypothetical protein